MAKNPADRFQTPGEVVEALRKYLETPPLADLPSPAPTPSGDESGINPLTPIPGPETAPAIASPSKDIPALAPPRRWLAWAALAGGIALFVGIGVFLLL